MKVIKVGNQITSLENVMSVGIGSKTDSIRITYTHGYVHPSAYTFCHNSTTLDYVHDVNKVMRDIMDILELAD